MKGKIAISLDSDTLQKIDAFIDGTIIRSRSQAIEVLVHQGLGLRTVNTAFLILGESHRETLFRHFKSSNVLEQQISFFQRNGIKQVYIVSQENIRTDKVPVIVTKEKSNADSIRHIRKIAKGDFVVMSGDVYINFDLQSMISKHLKSGKMATMGLRSSGKPSSYGTVVLEGDLITDFAEKPKKPESNVINSGVYIFSLPAFEFMRGSLERNVLPELAKKRQLIGYFINGEYVHFDEEI